MRQDQKNGQRLQGLDAFLSLALESFQSPKTACEKVMLWPLSASRSLELYALISVLSALATGLALMVLTAMRPEAFAAAQSVTITPISGALLQFAMMLGSAVLACYVGRAFGGEGTFEPALRLGVWLYTLLLAFDLLGLVFMIVLPVLSALITVAALMAFLYLVVSFIMALHGFENPALVILMIFATFVVLSFALMPLFIALGLVPEPGALQEAL